MNERNKKNLQELILDHESKLIALENILATSSYIKFDQLNALSNTNKLFDKMLETDKRRELVISHINNFFTLKESL